MKRFFLSLLALAAVLTLHAQQPQRAEALQARADSLLNAGEFTEAQALFRQACTAYEAAGRTQTREAAQCWHSLGLAYFRTNSTQPAFEATARAMQLREKLLGKRSKEYITSLGNYAIGLTNTEDYAKAIPMLQEAIALAEQVPDAAERLPGFYFQLGRSHYLAKQWRDAAAALERASHMIPTTEKTFETCLEMLYSCYEEMDDLEGMKRVMARAEEVAQEELKKPCNEPECMLERAQYYASHEDFEQAKKHFLQLFAMPLTPAWQLRAQQAYSEYLAFTLHDFQAAADYTEQAMHTHEALHGKNKDYYQLMHRAGVFYYIGHDHTNALRLLQTEEAYHLTSSQADAPKALADCRREIGKVFNAMKRYDDAIRYHTAVLQWAEQAEPQTKVHAKALEALGNAEKYAKRYDAARPHLQAAQSMYEALHMTEEAQQVANSLYTCQIYAKREHGALQDNVDAKAEQRRKLRSIIAQAKQTLELTDTIMGGLSRASDIGIIAGSYCMLDEFPASAEWYAQYVPALRSGLRHEFRWKTGHERMLAWEQCETSRESFDELFEHVLTTCPDSLPHVTPMAYDLALLSKGILLNSSIEFSKVIAASGNAALQQLYQRTMAEEARLQQLRQQAGTEAQRAEVLTLARENEKRQLQLAGQCAELADFTAYMGIGWQEVQKALKQGDVAIEFVVLSTGILDHDKHLVALVLCPGMQQPQAVRVGSVAEAAAMAGHDALFTATDTPLWRSLAPWVDGKQRIFFSPDGPLTGIAIEYMPYGGRPLSEQFEVWRLSSTKELCRPRHVALQRAALFGDIDYNDASADSQEQADSTALAMRGQGGGEQGTFGMLEATRAEVNDIAAQLRSAGLQQVKPIMADAATEAVFRALSGTRVNLIHIASHGAWRGTSSTKAHEAMTKSLLAFAGANFGGEADNDGIVTAADVADMDLRQCDLVVLSACETGLGHLDADGVYGLQRGFKNAGVHTLLMSLKEVYDTSTACMMSAFYRHLLAGCSKAEALRRAQQAVRQAGYTEPAHWASFILLDAF